MSIETLVTKLTSYNVDIKVNTTVFQLLMFPLLAALMLFLLVFSPNSHGYQDQSKKPIVIANSHAWRPYSFVDEDGKPAGILIDLWKAYGIHNQVEVSFLLTDWDQSLESVTLGLADVHGGLLWSEHRETFLDYGQTILALDTHFYVAREHFKSSVQEVAKIPNLKVGVVNASYEQEYMERHYPDLTLATFANNEAMLKAAFDREIFAFVADEQVANYYSFKSNQDRAFVSVEFLYSGQLRIGVSEGNQTILNSVDRGYSRIPKDDVEQIFSRWMHIKTVYPSYLVPTLVSIATILLVGYIVILKVAVKSKTRELEKANLELKVLSETDPLTGLINRRRLVKEFESKDLLGINVGVIVLDIDNFKYINDTNGHDTGDRVIAAVAQELKDLQTNDIIGARIGGEEFALLVKNTNFESVALLANQICTNIRAIDMSRAGVGRITVSVGGACYQNNYDKVYFTDADKLMYQAKRKGKDRAIVEQIDCARVAVSNTA